MKIDLHQPVGPRRDPLEPPRLPGEHDGEQDAGRGEEDDDQPEAEEEIAHRSAPVVPAAGTVTQTGSAAARQGPASAPWYDEWVSGAAWRLRRRRRWTWSPSPGSQHPDRGRRWRPRVDRCRCGAGRADTVPVRVRIPVATRCRCRFRERAKGAESTVSDIVDRPEEHRFVVTVDGHTAELVYRLRKDRLVLIHTEVPEALGGRGLGGELVEAAIDRAVRDRPDHRAALPLRPSMAREPLRRGGQGIDRLGARPVVQLNGPERPARR